MLTTVDTKEGCEKVHEQVDFGTSSGRPSARRAWLGKRTLRALGAALREGPAAYRRYHDLLLRDSPHDAALRQALGIAHEQD